MQWIQTDPAVRNQYNIGPLASYMMKVQGVDKLSKFEKTQEQIQYEQQLQAWQGTMVEWIKLVGKPKGGEGTGVWTPEEIRQAAGEMPQPPQTQQTAPKPNGATSA
jgi:hypothetical protein